MGAEHKMARRIQLRRDTATNWSSTNPVLAQGEIGIDLTNNKLKIGDGTSNWNTLGYWDDKEPSGFDGTYNSLSGKPEIPTAVSDLTNDLGYITSANLNVITPDDTEIQGISTLVFTGAGVTATSVGNAVTLDIPGGTNSSTGDFTFTNSSATVPVNSTLTLTAPNNTSLESKLTLSPTTTSSLYGGNLLEFGVGYGSVSEKYWILGADGSITFPDNSVQTTAYTGSSDLGTLKISASTIGTKDFPDTGNWGGYDLNLDPGGESYGYIQIPSVQGQSTGGQLTIANNKAGNGGIRLSVNTGDYYIRDTGLEIPPNHHILQGGTWTKSIVNNVTTGTPTVVWTSTVDHISSAKLVIQAECDEVGDLSGWHSQACEAIIACRGYANSYAGPGGDPQMIVYGVVHTSVDPLVTFTVQRNPTTKMVEVVATPTAAANGSPSLRIHSVEMSTTD